MLEPRHYVYGALLVIAIAVLGWLSLAIAANHSENIGQIGLYVGLLLATIGWIVTNETSIRNSRKQHTINLITTVFSSQHRIKDKELIQDRLTSYRVKFAPDHADFDDEGDSLINAIDRELNFIEFLAAGVFRRDIHEPLLKDCLERIVVNYYLQMEDYILYWRRRNSKTWELLTRLYERWRSENDPLPRPL